MPNDDTKNYYSFKKGDDKNDVQSDKDVRQSSDPRYIFDPDYLDKKAKSEKNKVIDKDESF